MSATDEVSLTCEHVSFEYWFARVAKSLWVWVCKKASPFLNTCNDGEVGAGNGVPGGGNLILLGIECSFAAGCGSVRAGTHGGARVGPSGGQACADHARGPSPCSGGSVFASVPEGGKGTVVAVSSS